MTVRSYQNKQKEIPVERMTEVEEPTSMGTIAISALIVSILGASCCIGIYYFFN